MLLGYLIPFSDGSPLDFFCCIINNSFFSLQMLAANIFEVFEEAGFDNEKQLAKVGMRYVCLQLLWADSKMCIRFSKLATL